MKVWKIILGVSLAGGVCNVAAFAQPDGTEKTIVVPRAPRRVRPLEPAGQIKQDLTEFVGSINNGNPFFENQHWIYLARDGYFGANDWMRKWRLHNVSLKIHKIAIADIEANEQGASATIIYSLTSLNTNRSNELKALLGGERTETVQLQLSPPEIVGEDSVWQIVPPDKQPQDLKISDFNNVFALMSFSLAQKPTVSPEAMRSLMRLKQLADGVAKFAQEHGENYAFAPEYIQEAVFPYVADIDAFFVPGTQEAYGFNANLSALNLAQVKDPVQTVLFYEGRNEKPIFRYGGKAAICFADGHVMLFRPGQIKFLIWNPFLDLEPMI